MASGLIPIVPISANSVSRYSSRFASRAVARIEAQTEIELSEIEAQTELQAARVTAVAYVGERAMHEVAMISQLEQQLASLVPMATSRLQAIGDVVALAAAEVVVDTVRKVSR